MADARPSILPARRERIEAAIERLIEALDQIDGDPDTEQDDEPEGDELEDDLLCEHERLPFSGFDGSGREAANNMLRRFGRAA